MIAKSHQRQLTAVAVAVLMGLWGTPASALSLGRISVQSALGEPLKAEIDILDINAEEAATLSTKVAPPEAFRNAGLDYNAAMSSLQATLQRRANGRAYIRLSSDRAINDPFVDMILEASWNTGRIVRDYTMLFDPPSLRAAVPLAPTPAQVPATVEARPATQATATAANVKPTAGSPPAAAPVKPEPAPPKAKLPPATKPAPASAPAGSPQVTVKPGDTASRLAGVNKSTSVSLDQMLVALLRGNPDAFIGDNVNRIKAGAIVTLPTPDQANGVPAEQASQIIVAQSRDFNDFRRQLASNAPNTPVAAASRTATGKVQASVEEKKPAAPTPDKLTLSKGTVSGKSAEDQLAQANNAREAASRTAEMAKNIQDLSKLAAASVSQTAAAPAPGASTATTGLPALPLALPSAPLPAVSNAASAATAVPAAASVPASAAPAAPSSAAKASAPKKPASVPTAPPAPATEPGFVDELLDNPLLPVGAAALIALLAGFGFYKVRQRKKAAAFDSAFSDTSLQPESFFGASGGQNVDTNDNPATGSSMVYSPSQLDAVDDVDPVAEADVYMAYGRDLQAEEILKDALRSSPNRLAIHQKLLEIYAKRQDAKAFEGIATLAFNLTDGAGADWEQVCDKGLALDPDNALYLPGGQPLDKSNPVTRPMDLEATQVLSTRTTSPNAEPDSVISSTELDLDLDFSFDHAASVPAPDSAQAAWDAGPAAVLPATDTPLPLPLPTLSLSAMPPATEGNPAQTTDAPSLGLTLDFSMPGLDGPSSPASFNKTQVLNAPAAQTSAPASADSGLLEFDLGSLSLDLGDAPSTQPGGMPNALEDPLETKLALAEEFKAIGDDDGARALIEEVIAEAAGTIKTKAQQALSRL